VANISEFHLIEVCQAGALVQVACAARRMRV